MRIDYRIVEGIATGLFWGTTTIVGISVIISSIILLIRAGLWFLALIPILLIISVILFWYASILKKNQYKEYTITTTKEEFNAR
jgi:type IV secretory pathway VirB3-like protein